jgi:glycosyltransferase involved in cell wall biosynthesis
MEHQTNSYAIKNYIFRNQLMNIFLEPQLTYQLLREIIGLRNFTTPIIPNRKRDYRNYYVLDRNPLIIVTMEATVDLQLFSEIIGKRKTYFLKFFGWSRETILGMYAEVCCYKKHQAIYPQHKIIFLCNTQKEMKLARHFKLPAIWCNHNGLLDENIYFIENPRKKQYDVIYNARLDPAKRHLLLTNVDNIALILGPNVNNSQKIKKYKDVIRSALPNAVVTNDKNLISLGECLDDEFIFPMLLPKDVVSCLNESRVGAILSREEGACYASAEYLLCGLPVVTTRNVGGRDVFLHADYVKYASPFPSAIKQAVEELIRSNFDPSIIRQTTLLEMEKHRGRFKNLLQEIYDQEGPGYNVREHWNEIFVNKMIIFGQKWPESLLSVL